MPDFKCVACRTRTRLEQDGEPCPTCGSPLEPVGELAEVVGFRSITTDGPVDTGAPLGDFTARRNAIFAQRVRDAVDAESGYAVAALALPTLHAGAPRETGTT